MLEHERQPRVRIDTARRLEAPGVATIVLERDDAHAVALRQDPSDLVDATDHHVGEPSPGTSHGEGFGTRADALEGFLTRSVVPSVAEAGLVSHTVRSALKPTTLRDETLSYGGVG